MNSDCIVGFVGGWILGMIVTQAINVYWYLSSLHDLDEYDPNAPDEE